MWRFSYLDPLNITTINYRQYTTVLHVIALRASLQSIIKLILKLFYSMDFI